MKKSPLQKIMSSHFEAVRLERMFPNSAAFEAKIIAEDNKKVRKNAEIVRMSLIQQNLPVGVIQSRVSNYLNQHLK